MSAPARDRDGMAESIVADVRRVAAAVGEVPTVGTYQTRYRLQHKSGQYRHIEDLGVVLPGEDGRA